VHDLLLDGAGCLQHSFDQVWKKVVREPILWAGQAKARQYPALRASDWDRHASRPRITLSNGDNVAIAVNSLD
jgi:hypothetical protein